MSPPMFLGSGHETLANRQRASNGQPENYQVSGFKKTKTTIDAKVNSPKHILLMLKNYEDISP